MEAKLAALQSKKPADETYVPGQGIDSKYNSPRPDTASRPGSGSASPAPEVDLDEEMGLDAATKAADELEREFGLEIAGRQPVGVTEETDGRHAPVGVVKENGAKGKETGKGSESENKGAELSEVERARQETFKKGLAGLPKKPTF